MTFELIPDATSPREAKDSAREEAHVVSHAKCLRCLQIFQGVEWRSRDFNSILDTSCGFRNFCLIQKAHTIFIV